MAISNISSVFLSLLVLINISNVKSDSFSFTFPKFEQGDENIVLEADSNISGGAIQLTKKDNLGNALQHSVGLSGYVGVVRLYDKDGDSFGFSTDFSFVVNRKGSELHGDGMTFFLASIDFDFPENLSSASGGFFGLFTNETAFNDNNPNNRIVAVEFDSYANEWDPNPVSQSPHIGININSIRSVATASWASDVEADGEIARATINYDSESLEMSVTVSYPNSKRPGSGSTVVKQEIDMKEVLPEWVIIGFSAATGELVETHDVLSWDYSATT